MAYVCSFLPDTRNRIYKLPEDINLNIIKEYFDEKFNDDCKIEVYIVLLGGYKYNYSRIYVMKDDINEFCRILLDTRYISHSIWYMWSGIGYIEDYYMNGDNKVIKEIEKIKNYCEDESNKYYNKYFLNI